MAKVLTVSNTTTALEQPLETVTIRMAPAQTGSIRIENNNGTLLLKIDAHAIDLSKRIYPRRLFRLAQWAMDE